MKPVREPIATKDWHPADIKAELEKAGWSFARIARENGYSNRTSPANVLRIPWAPMEKIVGDILGRHPMEIWPSRYDENGEPFRRRSYSSARVAKRKDARNG